MSREYSVMTVTLGRLCLENTNEMTVTLGRPCLENTILK